MNNPATGMPMSVDIKLSNGKTIEDCTIDYSSLNGQPDFRVGHFGYNCWFRSEAACRLSYKGVNSARGAQIALSKLAKAHKFEILKIHYTAED